MSDENKNIENNQEENQNNNEKKKTLWNKLLGLRPALQIILKKTIKIGTIILISVITIYLFNFFQEKMKISNYKKKYENLNNNEFLKIEKMKNKATSLKLILLQNNKVLISGGNYIQKIDEYEILDPNRGSYKIVKIPAKYKKQRNSMLLDKNNILINDSFIYNNKTGKYTNIFGKHDYTNYSTSFLYSENKIFIIEEDKECYLYDFKNKLLTKENFQFPFLLANKTFIKMDNNNVFIYGIRSFSGKPGAYYQTDFYLWDTNKNQFKKLNSNGISTDVSIIKLNNDEVLIFGQKYFNQNDTNIGNKKQVTYKLNVKTNKLSEKRNSIIDRISAPIVIKLSDNKIFLIGGENHKENGLMTAELYNINTDEYLKLSSIISSYIPANIFNRPSLLELSNNDILLCGGKWESQTLDNCIIYKREYVGWVLTQLLTEKNKNKIKKNLKK